jgi:hypothetical protein
MSQKLNADGSLEPREGIATVYDHAGRYVGCIGIETWWRLVAEEAERRSSCAASSTIYAGSPTRSPRAPG